MPDDKKPATQSQPTDKPKTDAPKEQDARNRPPMADTGKPDTGTAKDENEAPDVKEQREQQKRLDVLVANTVENLNKGLDGLDNTSRSSILDRITTEISRAKTVAAAPKRTATPAQIAASDAAAPYVPEPIPGAPNRNAQQQQEQTGAQSSS
jgi:hypothetical protein